MLPTGGYILSKEKSSNGIGSGGAHPRWETTVILEDYTINCEHVPEGGHV